MWLDAVRLGAEACAHARRDAFAACGRIYAAQELSIRFADLRAAGVHRPRTKPFGVDPLTHRRELWSGPRDAAPLFRIAQERVFSAAVLGAARTDLSALA